ncbi:MAG: PepSY domain-containing protein [Sphingomonadales bacterium]|jgi:opacity protein-like surface antigen|nr:PepSY domain-containing protein [Sphingomonadales bacterium]MBN9353017.1 PepSY domain-containing protein [Hyphomicrobium denitrificans]
MKRMLLAASLVCALSLPALADAPLSAEEQKQATAAAAAWGCEGGKWEKETEATGVYELDDAKCKDGAAYDLKFDKDFKLRSITAD